MNSDSTNDRIDTTILIASWKRVTDQLTLLSGQREKWRQLAFIVVGAIIGFGLKETNYSNALMILAGGALASIAFWIQDHRLHKYDHSWRDVDRQIRHFVSGEILPQDFKLFHFNRTKERDAKWHTWSSLSSYGLLMVGAILAVAYKYSTH